MANPVERAMFLQRFLEHHALRCDPFAYEDAQHDRVFEEQCLDETYHPAWQRVVGNLAAPESTLVFGDPGSGKTALRLQIARHVPRHNCDFPDRRAFLIQYDDPGRFIDCFLARVGAKRDADYVARHWKLADHVDAILLLGVTRLVNQILVPRHISPKDHEPLDIAALSPPEVRDLLLLAACYDAPADEPIARRWQRLRKVLRYRGQRVTGPLLLGLAATAGAFLVAAKWGGSDGLSSPWPYAAAAAGWWPWLATTLRRLWRAHSIARNLRVLVRKPRFLRSVFRLFRRHELREFALPGSQPGAERLQLLQKFQAVLRGLGYKSLLVVVDGIDATGCLGDVDRAYAFVTTLLDDRLLGLPNFGIKLLLPAEMRPLFRGETENTRLSIVSLEWSPASLYDLANARLAACSTRERPTTLCELFEGAVTESHLMEAFGHLRSPRDVNRFLGRLVQCHTSRHTSMMPVWQISAETLAAGLAECRK